MSRVHYDGRAASWRDAYRSSDPFARRVQRRGDAVVAAVQARLGGRRARVLDAGCGTGELARRLQGLGHAVAGVDLSHEMLVTASRERRNTDAGPSYARGSVVALPFRPASFDVAICVGVLGLMPRRREAGGLVDQARDVARELERVVRPDGFLVVTFPNLLRLHWLLDPLQLRKSLARRRRLLGGATEVVADGKPVTHHRTPGELRRVLREEGLEVADRRGVGFGPFTILGRPVMSFERSVRMSERIEGLVNGAALRPLSRFAATCVLTLVRRGPAS